MKQDTKKRKRKIMQIIVFCVFTCENQKVVFLFRFQFIEHLKLEFLI